MSKNEMILINGDVITLSKGREPPKTLVIRNGKIAALDPLSRKRNLPVPGLLGNTASAPFRD